MLPKRTKSIFMFFTYMTYKLRTILKTSQQGDKIHTIYMKSCQVSVHIYVCMYVCMYVRTYVCICIPATFTFNLHEEIYLFFCFWYDFCPCQYHSMWLNNKVPGLMLWEHTYINQKKIVLFSFTIIYLIAIHFLHISKTCTK
jgi:hypothetical protein